MKWPLKNKIKNIPEVGAVGDFASKRSFYYHPGIDLYCNLNDEVVAIEDGIVVNIEQFTGTNADPTSPWWNDTWAILIEGNSGAIGYCELKPLDHIVKNYKVAEGEVIGSIIPVLKKDKGNGTTMLHLEQYTVGARTHATWKHDEPIPSDLVNPRPLLESISDGFILDGFRNNGT